MAKYILPFTEVQRGWYEIEAESLDEAQELSNNTDYVMDLEAFYKDGYTDWDVVDLLEEVTRG